MQFLRDQMMVCFERDGLHMCVTATGADKTSMVEAQIGEGAAKVKMTKYLAPIVTLDVHLPATLGTITVLG